MSEAFKLLGVEIKTDPDLPPTVMQLRNADGSGLQWDFSAKKMTTLLPWSERSPTPSGGDTP